MTQTEIANLLPAFLRNSVTYSVVITDMEGNYSYVNDLFKKRFAFLGVDFIGKPFQVAMHPGDVDSAIEVVHQCFANPDKVFPIDIRKPSNNENEFHWTHWEFSLFKNAAGNPAGILCLGHDITAGKRSAAQIVDQNERLKQITWQQSHELRRHVVNIMGLYNIIKFDAHLSEEEKTEHLETLLKETKELDLTIHSIVASSI